MSVTGNVFIVSNRMPVTVTQTSDGIALKKSSGGLVTALNPVHSGSKSYWVGYMGNMQLTEEVNEMLTEERYIPVEIDENLYADYYNGLSNAGIWPLFHYFPGMAEFNHKQWDAYRQVNELFAARISPLLEPDDFVWVHDYQLMLLPDLIRRRRPDVRIGYFHHIPFPASEVLKIFPWRNEIIRGLLGADVVGFHTLEYARHFISTTARLMGCENVAEDVHYRERVIKVGAFLIGIDVETVNNAMKKPEHKARLESLTEALGDKALLVGVDRLDYTKGIRERLLAYEQFLQDHPELVSKTAFIQLCVPSRVEVKQYNDLRNEIESLVGRINGQYGSTTHTPVQYLFQSLGVAELTALFKRADVALVTPLRDGLNLVCKEYVESHDDLGGVLILSEFAGAAEEMGEALTVNPFDVRQTAAAIYRALTMPEEEKKLRMRNLRARVHEFNNQMWADSFIEILNDAVEKNRANKSKILSRSELENIGVTLSKSRRPVLAVHFEAILEKPTERYERVGVRRSVLEKLQRIVKERHFEVAILAGKSKHVLENAILSDNFWLIAENGAFLRYRGHQDWITISPYESLDSYRGEILRIFERCIRRVPGSHIEERETSILWHYRQVGTGSAFAQSMALEIAHNLNQMLNKSTYHCVVGRSGLEIRSSPLNGGNALQSLLEIAEVEPTQPLVSLGDERSDEEFFSFAPDRNISITVGRPGVFSRFVLRSHEALEDVLEEWAQLFSRVSATDISSGPA